MIQLRVLGSPDLRGDDGQVVLSLLSRPKRLTVFTYLVLTATGKFVPRDRLVALFWPESDYDHGRGSLRTALSALRKSLGTGVLTTRGDDGLGIASGTVSCDAVEFEAALDRGELEFAWDHYGGPLLESVSAPEYQRVVDQWADGDDRGKETVSRFQERIPALGG